MAGPTIASLRNGQPIALNETFRPLLLAEQNPSLSSSNASLPWPLTNTSIPLTLQARIRHASNAILAALLSAPSPSLTLTARVDTLSNSVADHNARLSLEVLRTLEAILLQLRDHHSKSGDDSVQAALPQELWETAQQVASEAHTKLQRQPSAAELLAGEMLNERAWIGVLLVPFHGEPPSLKGDWAAVWQAARRMLSGEQ